MHLARVEGQRHRRDEQVRLSVEVVMDEGGVHPGGPGHGAQTGALVPLGGEGLLGRPDDVLARVALAGTSAPDSGVLIAVYSPLVNSMVKLINGEP